MAIAKDWIVDGTVYTTMKAVFREAVKRGYNGGFGSLVHRVRRDEWRGLTFARLAMPIMTRPQRRAANRALSRATEGVHWIVEGRRFHSLASLHREAVARGYVGSVRWLTERVKKKMDLRWDELCVPVSQKSSAATKASYQKRREEMAALIQDLDARKAAMK